MAGQQPPKSDAITDPLLLLWQSTCIDSSAFAVPELPSRQNNTTLTNNDKSAMMQSNTVPSQHSQQMHLHHHRSASATGLLSDSVNTPPLTPTIPASPNLSMHESRANSSDSSQSAAVDSNSSSSSGNNSNSPKKHKPPGLLILSNQPAGRFQPEHNSFVVEDRNRRSSHSQTAMVSPTLVSTFTLKILDNLKEIPSNWTPEEFAAQRRLVEFFPNRDSTSPHITLSYKVVAPSSFVPNTIVISCIYWAEKNLYFVTSVDIIYLLEAILGVRFNVEEKNRIRRNLEGFKPITLSKNKNSDFFKLIMAFGNPKPRNIEKDVKVFAWHVLDSALCKIVGRWGTNYLLPTPPPTNSPNVYEANQTSQNANGPTNFTQQITNPHGDNLLTSSI
ncbi:hypothetical protein BKA69DRAFT_548597 [Paraphysoderma sedebokerense]|nr:hypothetical protein BKA69DRAFT_548597 [Paraphysoderma sedebokerense]